ncbi:MAG: glucose-methanol-choline oxidoreductase, partial [Actinoallomurus sp.]|nr:glucose-methanol-choline oxidoreductase [Actinoallomurus sp.]
MNTWSPANSFSGSGHGRTRRARRPDVLVVGAGGSGATLAARLSEDAGREVLVLEAGPVPRSPSEFP